MGDPPEDDQLLVETRSSLDRKQSTSSHSEYCVEPFRALDRSSRWKPLFCGNTVFHVSSHPLIYLFLLP
jgi:hypothetical protein